MKNLIRIPGYVICILLVIFSSCKTHVDMRAAFNAEPPKTKQL